MDSIVSSGFISSGLTLHSTEIGTILSGSIASAIIVSSGGTLIGQSARVLISSGPM